MLPSKGYNINRTGDDQKIVDLRLATCDIGEVPVWLISTQVPEPNGTEEAIKFLGVLFSFPAPTAMFRTIATT
ncbi:hypothetical protein [Microcoleus sp. LEGE 07076]|nr:hypothetical protein [Microcoleus sp. LEGE 07076]